MKKDKSFTESSTLTAVRLPKVLKHVANEKCKAEDITLSQLMRRALRREISKTEEAV